MTPLVYIEYISRNDGVSIETFRHVVGSLPRHPRAEPRGLAIWSCTAWSAIDRLVRELDG